MTRREAKAARRRARIVARDPGSPRHLRSLLRHRTLGAHARLALKGDVSARLGREIDRQRGAEATRLLQHSSRLQRGAAIMERMMAQDA